MSHTEPSQSIFKSGLFAGRVALVTGGATGIGLAITRELMLLGCNVVIASRKLERLETAALQLRADRALAGDVSVCQVDIRREDQVQHMMHVVQQRYATLDFLVNNGGGQFPSATADISANGWSAVVDTNLKGTFLCCREAYRTFFAPAAVHSRPKGGAIVNIVADVARGFPGMAHTGAARAGVENLTRSLAVEWSSAGVRVNAVAPGIIWSQTAAANYTGVNVGLLEGMRPGVPAKRLGTPEEVAAAVCFLLSPAAAYITGVNLPVDGGSSTYTRVWDVPEHTAGPAPWPSARATSPESKL